MSNNNIPYLINTGIGTRITINNGAWTTSNGNYIISNKNKYIVLDTEIEVDGYQDSNLLLAIAMININGIKLYLELKKQKYCFPNEIETFLEKELTSYYRNKTIDEVISQTIELK